jgi:tRNA(Met) cytidine acetyltransferase
MIQSLISWFSTLQAGAELIRQRRLIVILGDEQWHKTCVESALSVMQQTRSNGHENNNNQAQDFFVYQNSSVQYPKHVEFINHQNFRHFLGRETSLLIFDGLEKFWVDDFTALSGTVMAGGLILLHLPSDTFDIAYHKKQQSYFNAYFADQINADNNVLVLQQGKNELPNLSAAHHIPEKVLVENLPSFCKTTEQAIAVTAIKKVLSGHRKRPLVLTADRGRGKSSALAIAVADIISKSSKHIVITAPQPQALTVFFAQLTRCLPAIKKLGNKWQYLSSAVQFIPVDLLNE